MNPRIVPRLPLSIVALFCFLVLALTGVSPSSLRRVSGVLVQIAWLYIETGRRG
ncbi:MAG: hypothetical protein H0W08_24305 [Acidobacteria bacterium]|nr:hypothetical protein [Acidobacteriota bacterium]